MSLFRVLVIYAVFGLQALSGITLSSASANILSDPETQIAIAKKSLSSDSLESLEWENPNTLPAILNPGEVLYLKFFWETGEKPERAVVYSQLAPLTTFTLYRDGVTYKAGSNVPFYDRPVSHRFPAIGLDLPADSRMTLYLEISAEEYLATTTILPTLSERKHFYKTTNGDNLFFATTFGFMGMMILYNLFYFLFLRKRVFIFYSFLLASLIFFLMTYHGYAYALFLRNYPQLNAFLVPFFLVAIPLFGILFTRDYLLSYKFSPRMDFILKVFVGIFIIFLLASSFLPTHILITGARILVATQILLQIPATYFSIRKKHILAWFILVSFIPVFLAGEFKLLESLGVYQTTGDFNKVLQLALIVEIVILSAGLTFQSYQLHVEKQKSDRELRYTNEKLELGKAAQESMLPPGPIRTKQFSTEHAYLPIHHVGGDYFQYVEKENGVGILIADVSGHGVAAALYGSMLNFAFFNAEIDYTKPSALLSFMNSSLFGALNNHFLTAIYIWHDKEANTFTFANAGHPKPVVYNRFNDEVADIGVRGRAIGLASNVVYEQLTVPLKKGDRVFLYTDGLSEMTESSNKMLGEEGVFDLVFAQRSKNGGELAAELQRMIDLQQKKGNVEDDITFIILDATDEAA